MLYSKAKHYIMEAKDILFAVEVGEDKSFAMYCDAIISAATLTDKSSQYEFDVVTHKFEVALIYSQFTYDMDILVIYCFLRLGRLYLGKTEKKCANEEHVQLSKDCQLKLKSDFYSKMDEQCRGLYYLNECDLHMSTSKIVLAAESAKQAKVYAEQSGCPLDIEAVRIRLKAVTILQDRKLD